MSAGIVEVGQALHGYDAGHRLIASSVDLPAASNEILTALSDLSGSRVFPGYETYLTGYPLPHSDYYVLARTWLAPEMPRPGCVWTHSLLVQFADLAHLQSLSRLLELHRRPGMVRKNYDVSLSIAVKGLPLGHLDDDSALLAPPLLKCLYGRGPIRPVVVSTASPGLYENLVLRVWDQQWPRLRRAFRFCTGALSRRVVDGADFDLQVMPDQVARSAQHSIKDSVALDQNMEAINASSTEPLLADADAGRIQWWLSVMTRDLVAGDPDSPFRQWMILIGAHGSEPRSEASFGLELASILSSTQPDVDRILNLLAERYPGPSDGLRLKTALLAGSGSNGVQRDDLAIGLSPRFRHECLVLKALGRTPLPEAFASLTPTMRPRATAFWLNNRYEAEQLLDDLLSSSVNELGAEALRGLMAGVDPKEMAAIARQRRGVLFLAVESRPAILASEGIWEDKTLAHEALQALHVVPENERPQLSAILPAVLRWSPESLDQLFRIYGAEAVTDAAAAAFRSKAVDIEVLRTAAKSKQWRDIASRVLSDALDRADDASTFSVVRPILLAADTQAVRAISPARWISSLIHAGVVDSSVATRLFVAALGENNRDASELAALVFPIVYEAARTRALAEDDWRIVSESLPAVPLWLEWDRCERLRRGCVQSYASKSKWKYRDFVSAFKNLEALRAVCSYANSESWLRDFLSRLADAVKKGKTSATEEQRSIILEAAKPKWTLW